MNKTLYQLRGLPIYYFGLTYSDTKLPQLKYEALQLKIAKAPTSGVLLVSGCAAPIVNQLMETRKVMGVDFIEYYEERFTDKESSTLPNAPVVVLYGVGSEPARNSEYAARLLQSIIGQYKSSETLLIIETELTKSNFMTKYGIDIKNSVVVPLKEEEAWI